MLKNNAEREQYISDPKNWDILNYDIIDSECSDEEADKELHGGLITGIPTVRLERLRGTSVYRIRVLSAPLHYSDKEHFVEIGLKVFEKNGNLHSIYDLTPNQLIAYLREHKV